MAEEQTIGVGILSGGGVHGPRISGNALAGAVLASERGEGLRGITNEKGESTALKAAEILAAAGKLTPEQRKEVWALSTAVLTNHNALAVALAFIRMCPPHMEEAKALEAAWPEIRELIKLMVYGITGGLKGATEDEKVGGLNETEEG